MKKLNPAGENPLWNERLVRDIVFIKKHMRYPINTRTVVPALFLGALIGLSLWLFLPYLFNSPRSSNAGTYVVVALVLIPMLLGAYRYLQTLKFISVPCPLSGLENIRLMQKFLADEHLVSFRHPEVPGIFQIVSRDLGRGNDQREILIFIADDQRILLNSHFTGPGYKMVPSSGSCKQMAKTLKAWLDENLKNTNSSISHNKYF